MFEYKQGNSTYEAYFEEEDGELLMYERMASSRPGAPFSEVNAGFRDISIPDDNNLGVPAGLYRYNPDPKQLQYNASPQSTLAGQTISITPQHLAQGTFYNLGEDTDLTLIAQQRQQVQPQPAPAWAGGQRPQRPRQYPNVNHPRPLAQPQGMQGGIAPRVPARAPAIQRINYNDPAIHAAINTGVRPDKQFPQEQNGKSTLKFKVDINGKSKSIKIVKYNNKISAVKVPKGGEAAAADVMVKAHVEALKAKYNVNDVSQLTPAQKSINVVDNPSPAMKQALTDAATNAGLNVAQPANARQQHVGIAQAANRAPLPIRPPVRPPPAPPVAPQI